MWVSNGRALAPPWISCSIGVSTSVKPRACSESRTLRTTVGARVRDVAGFRSHDQVDVAGPDPRLGVGQALVLVGQRAERLAGDLQRLGTHGQLAALAW